jgi:FdrA protein
MIVRTIVKTNRYADSVFLMSLAGRAGRLEGIEEVSALMGTPENKRLLDGAGLLDAEGEKARPDDLIIALRAGSEESLQAAVERIDEWMTRQPAAVSAGEERPPRTLGAALKRWPDAAVVLISVPGRYAFREARIALRAGRHVMIFSDHVSLEDEMALKEMAAEHGLMVMGPDCGTSILGGKVLGFGNAMRPGRIGIAGASGTGIQEICSLLDRFDEGISHAIGLGGRDLSGPVGGRAAVQAIGLLADDPATDLICFVSKPPDPEITAMILGALAAQNKPAVACFLGALEMGPEMVPENVLAASLLKDAPSRIFLHRGDARSKEVLRFEADAAGRIDRFAGREIVKLADEQRHIRGLFSGGSLCAEAGVFLSHSLGELFSNIGLPGSQPLEESSAGRGHTLIDLGADEFTAGVPHPMIDFTIRNQRLIQEAEDPRTAVILFDLVLGYGAHPDPAGAILPAVRQAREIAAKRGGHLCCVASLCGTRGDPQGLERQRRMLEEQGILVCDSAVHAAAGALRVALRGEADGFGKHKPGEGKPAKMDRTSRQGGARSLPEIGSDLLARPLKVINLGLSWFAETLAHQDVPVLQVDWRPPAGGDQRLLEVLRKLQ